MTGQNPLGGLSGFSKALVLLFLVTLPLVNPWIRGDGVGYYAYVRSVLIDHDLRFENEWLAGNSFFVQSRLDSSGGLRADLYTPTGRIANLSSVGPSILWAPFLVVTHAVVLALDRVGFSIPADGYSRPYVTTMAVATALYGFLGLCFAYALARKYFGEAWAFLATVGIWFASSLPVYMYFNPSWSHAHSAFTVAWFLWYWHRTREGRTFLQWILLGLLAGLVVDVYYPNGLVLLVPLLESLRKYWHRWSTQPRGWSVIGRLIIANLLFAIAGIVAFLPTIVTRAIIFGSPFSTGYAPLAIWNWSSPALWQVLFSSNHGLLSWTPILIPALLGLGVLWRSDRFLACSLGAVFLVFYYLIASYSSWHGISSFGNRLFISLTPLFVLGLAAMLSRFGEWLRSPRVARMAAGATVGVFVLWNVGFIYQWGMHLISPRGPISWPTMIHNQVAVVPGRLLHDVSRYLFHRGKMMKAIEETDNDTLQKK
jgi:hypothetical protein